MGANIFNSTIIELCKDIVRVYQKITTSQPFMFVAKLSKNIKFVNLVFVSYYFITCKIAEIAFFGLFRQSQQLNGIARA